MDTKWIEIGWKMIRKWIVNKQKIYRKQIETRWKNEN